MKNTLLLAVAFFTASITAIAQPTMTAANANPVAGEIFYGRGLDTTGQTMGASGAGVTWTFASTIDTVVDTTSYLECAATPYCDSFPGATIVSYNGADYIYGIFNSVGISFIGANSTGANVHFTNPQNLFAFPFTYGDTHDDTAAAYIATPGIWAWIYTHQEADAWGTITVPSGTYANALRIHTITINKDSLNVMGFPVVQTSATETYSWFVPGLHSPLLSATYDTSGTGTSTLTELKHYKRSIPVQVTDVSNTASSLSVFPNPANGSNVTIRFNIPTSGDATLTISDITGKAVYSTSGMERGTNSISVSTTSLPGGVYIASLRSGNGTATTKFVVNN